MKMRKWKKYVALLLALAMVASLTVTSLAETDDSDTIEGVVVEASESADVEVTDDTEDEEVSDKDAAVEQTEDEDAEETEIETAEVSEETEDAEVTEDDSEEILSVSSQAVSVLSSEDEYSIYEYYSGYSDQDCITNTKFRISKEYGVYCSIETHEQGETFYSTENISVKEVTAVNEEGENLEVGEEDDYFFLIPDEEGTVIVTLYYDPIDGSEDENGGQCSFNLYVSDTRSWYYLNVASDNYSDGFTGTLVPGQSLNLTATCRYHMESADGIYEDVYDGVAEYKWTVDSSDPDNAVEISPSGNTCKVSASSEGTAVICVEAYDGEGKYLTRYSYNINIQSEYYDFSVKQYVFTLEPGEVAEIEPSLMYYTANNPDGEDVTNKADYSLSLANYYIPEENLFLLVGIADDDDLEAVGAVSVDSDSLTVTARSCSYSEVEAYVSLYAIIEDSYYHATITILVTSDSESVDSRTATVYYSDIDETDSYTPEDVSSALPPASKSGYTFDGWTFDGVEGTYTTLTDDLLTALSALGVDTITATASFTEIVSEDARTVYYLDVKSDSSTNTLLPGQSLNLTATYKYDTFSADGDIVESGVYDGNVDYEWSISSSYPDDAVEISSSGNTCEVLALVDEGTVVILVDAYDDEGNHLTVHYYIYIQCEHENLIHYEGKDPTCTTDGNEEYWVCSDCGLMFRDGDATDVISEVPVISATGHTWGDEVIWEWADDYSSATATFTCAVCGETCDVDAVITSEQTDDGIIYTAEATLDDVSAADTKSVSITSTTVTGDTQSSVDDSVDEAYQETAENVAASVDVGDALQNVAQELSDDVDYAEVLEKLADKGITIDENSDVTITTETYLVTIVRALEIDEEAGTAVLTIDISMYYTVTASAGGNSVTIDDGKVTKTTWDPIEVTIDVTGIPFADVDSIYVRHNASDGTYYYKASYDESAQTITFTNLHGFSEFTVSVDSRTATVYYSDIDETDSYTPEDVSSALPTASKSGYTFDGWTFDGVEGTYTTLTDDLLTALSALGVDTITATASFTEIVSEDTTDTDSETADSTADNTDSTTETTDDADSATETTDSSSAAATSTGTTATGDYNTAILWVMLVLAGAVAVFGVIRRRSNAR